MAPSSANAGATSVTALQAEAAADHSLKRALGVVNLTALGVGASMSSAPLAVLPAVTVTVFDDDGDNGELLAYSKRSLDGRDLILVVLNLDPVNMQHGFVQLPIVAWGLTPHATVEVVDLLSTERYFWRGEWNYIRLDPQDRVAHILHVQLPAPLPSSSSYV